MGDETHNEQATAQSNGATIVNGVLVDMIDLGVQETPWGPKRQLQPVFEIDEVNEQTALPLKVRRTLNNNLHEKSTLRGLMKSWRGWDLTENELKNGINWSKQVGKPCRLEIVDAISKNGHAYLKLLNILPPGKTKLEPSGFYKRWEPAKEPAPVATEQPELTSHAEVFIQLNDPVMAVTEAKPTGAMLPLPPQIEQEAA
ncbi:MAG: hypothetical protein FJ403_05890 [Verrucomicrobia bacterium]|nr:hypothetical protein [Verrucomicrobiota bacterium]